MKEYIEREAVLETIKVPVVMSMCMTITECAAMNRERATIFKQISLIPAADVVPVVRCKDCVYYQDSENLKSRILYGGIGAKGVTRPIMVCTYAIDYQFYRKPNDYCSKGERREEGE